MKIALVSSFVPFIFGGARNIVEWLEEHLRAAGHTVERIYLPQVDAPDVLFPQMAAYRWIDLSSADRVICFRPPAHMIRHPHKILWFIHHIRLFYDLWDTPYRDFPEDSKHLGLREALWAADTAALMEARKIFTNSKVVSDRLTHFNQVKSEILYPPILNPERFTCKEFNDEVVYVSRFEHHKRQHLLVEAMEHTKTAVKIRLCGTGSKPYIEEMRQTINRSKLHDKVILEDRWISEEEKVNILANSLATAYLPLDEDSYGYPSLESSHSAKAILTVTDSGGVIELVKDGVNGLITEPTPQAIAEALDRFYLDRAATRRMGKAAEERLGEMNISWPHVLERLMG
ncbi:MAG: glycosyltransferase family 4 protein [Alphaproteobacteria bacterium]|nr:MAG: glycosyltransferase family 4 protein [Alphaproteobacteria bacterium]